MALAMTTSDQSADHVVNQSVVVRAISSHSPWPQLYTFNDGFSHTKLNPDLNESSMTIGNSSRRTTHVSGRRVRCASRRRGGTWANAMGMVRYETGILSEGKGTTERHAVCAASNVLCHCRW